MRETATEASQTEPVHALHPTAREIGKCRKKDSRPEQATEIRQEYSCEEMRQIELLKAVTQFGRPGRFIPVFTTARFIWPKPET